MDTRDPSAAQDIKLSNYLVPCISLEYQDFDHSAHLGIGVASTALLSRKLADVRSCPGALLHQHRHPKGADALKVPCTAF